MLALALLLATVAAQLPPDSLQQEIANTHALLALYQRKLQLLTALHQTRYPHLPLPDIPASSPLPPPSSRSHPKLLLLHRFPHQAQLLPPSYLLSSNRILSLPSLSEIGEVIGSPLTIEPLRLTTLISGKVSMSELKLQSGTVRKEEYFLGLDAEQLSSLWHRNYNLKDGEDLLVQWGGNRLKLRGKEVREVALGETEVLLAVYSLNQYKLILVSDQRIATLNTRSLQVGDQESVRNISKANSSAPFIVNAHRHDGVIYLLLSTGEVAKYLNDRIALLQQLELPESSLEVGSAQLHFLPPYLFLTHAHLSLLRVYAPQGIRFLPLTDIHLPSPPKSAEADHSPADPQDGLRTYTFYRQGEAFHLLFTLSNQTYLYELLLPAAEEPPAGNSYLKIIGVIVAVGCFVYFKMGSKQEEPIKVQPPFFKKEKPERAEREVEKGKAKVGGEIDDFLRRKAAPRPKQS